MAEREGLLKTSCFHHYVTPSAIKNVPDIFFEHSSSQPSLSNIFNKSTKADLIKYGGERGIRTLDELLTHTPLAGERLQPLGHLSNLLVTSYLKTYIFLNKALRLISGIQPYTPSGPA